MAAVEVTKAEQKVLDAMRAYPALKGAFAAMIAAVQSGALDDKNATALANASAALPEPKTAPTITIEQMKEVLRAADCLYDDTKRWKQLGATKVPKIPDTVIREAYEKGGRVILRCSSISEKADALRWVLFTVDFWGSAEQSDYQKRVKETHWIVVPSHIARSTLGSPKSKVVTSEMPAPTPEDWFSVLAYARLDGGRQPKGFPEGLGQSLYAFTTETGTVVGSSDGSIIVDRYVIYDRYGRNGFGAARFGPPRKLK
jgi:hypothetical protein